MESYLVIGGEGFLGHNMVLSLLEKYPGASVSSLDLVQRYFPEKGLSWTFHSADLTDLASLSKAVRASGATTVFHTASPWIGSGRDVCEKVNVVGTQTVVDACQQEGVKKLVFTSSAGTVFDGHDLINVDERMPFPQKAIDHYNETKHKAESVVLAANGIKGLLTVAIRPAGIFGPGDRQAIPGFLGVLKEGKTGFQIGNGTNLFDWTYVDNVVHAHLLAAERLTTSLPSSSLNTRLPAVGIDVAPRVLPTSTYRPPALFESERSFNPSWENTSSPDKPLPAGRNRYDPFFDSSTLPLPDEMAVAGQAFFVTNGEPIGFWDFGRAVWFAYNGHEPKRVVVLPKAAGTAIGALAEAWAWLTGKPTPNITRARVVYTTSHRYYNVEKARRVLGYEPVVGLEEGVKRALAWYKENEVSASAPKTA